MIYELQIKTTSQWLGDVVTHEKVRRFRRCRGSSDLQPDPVFWRWVFRQAAESLRLDVNMEAVYVPSSIRVPRLDLYRRRFRRKGHGQNKEAYDDFECIPVGAVLTLYLQTCSSVFGKEKDKVPSASDLYMILKFIGLHMGLSPWGSKFDYGRFDILYLKPLENPDELPSDIFAR